MVVVPVVRAKAMGREPMLLLAGGGQSWLVGKLGVTGESAGSNIGSAVIGAAVALPVARADGANLHAHGAEPAARARRVGGAHGAGVGAAHAVVASRGVRGEQISGEEEGRGERQADGRSAAG